MSTSAQAMQPHRPRVHLQPAVEDASVRLVDRQEVVLIARLVAGDDSALAEVFDQFAPAVHAVARKTLGDSPAAEDVVQDVFVWLWQRPERYDASRGSLRAFLTTLAHHRSVDIVRSELRRVGRERLQSALVPDQRSPGDEADARIVAELVRDAISLLPGEQRQVVELAYFQGLSYRDVAAAVGIPEGTAKSRLRLAMAKLEAALDPQLLETS